jgi:hypothetical protein
MLQVQSAVTYVFETALCPSMDRSDGALHRGR